MIGRTLIPARSAALVLVFLWFFLGGNAHFAFTEVETRPRVFKAGE